MCALPISRLRIRFVAPAIGGKQQGQPIGRLPFHLQAAAKRILPPQFRVACVILLPWSRNSRTARQANRDRVTDWPANVGLAIKCIRSEEHTSELQSLMRLSYSVF